VFGVGGGAFGQGAYGAQSQCCADSGAVEGRKSGAAGRIGDDGVDGGEAVDRTRGAGAVCLEYVWDSAMV
jgi:hypothetical protein